MKPKSYKYLVFPHHVEECQGVFDVIFILLDKIHHFHQKWDGF